MSPGSKLISLMKSPWAIGLFACVAFTFANCGHKSVSKNPLRDPKLMYMPFLKVIIPPEPCGSDTNGIRDGVCLTKGKCDKLNGDRAGECSMGFGECCRLSLNCTSDISRIDVQEYVSVLKTPNPTTTGCTFKIRRLKDVCQVRLDFRTFSTTHANTNGICDDDQLLITNSVTVPDGFATCGELRDQHMYLSFGGSDSIDITPRLINSNSRYEIVVTQIPCFSKRVVPSYCLQYYNKTTDIVRSFDYPYQQQSNQKYVVCVESTEQSNYITWKRCTAADGNTGGSEPFFISNPDSSNTNGECPTDWIQINGDYRYCEKNFPESLMTSWKPYLMNVNFDESEVPDFPLGTAPQYITNGLDCGNLNTTSMGLLGCVWYPNTPRPGGEGVGVCQCDFNIPPPASGDPPFPIQALFGIPDVNNTGFCLKYQV